MGRTRRTTISRTMRRTRRMRRAQINQMHDRMKITRRKDEEQEQAQAQAQSYKQR